MLPLLESQFNFDDEEIAELLQQRKHEVVETIMCSLRPKNK